MFFSLGEGGEVAQIRWETIEEAMSVKSNLKNYTI